MTTSRRIFFLILLSGGLVAAGPPALRAADKQDDAERARVVLRHYCQDCHSGTASQARAALQVFDHNLLLQRKVVRPNDPAGSELFQLVDCGSMPPGELPKPRPEEVDALRTWIADGAPDPLAEYGDAYVMRKIQRDLLSLNSKDVPFQRYVSFNHLLADDPAADATLWRDALLKALNHLSLKPDPVPVTPIDPAATIFRVDLRQLGWDVQLFETPDKTPSHVDLFDLLLLEYPFAVLPSHFEGDRKILGDYLRKANPVRPILYVRGDWLVSTATQPPLYEDLLRLPRTLPELEAKIGATVKGSRAAFSNSKVSRLAQMVERRKASSDGAYWRTFNSGGVRDLKGLLQEAASDADRGGLMLFTLPNGLNGYYIAESVPDVGGKRQVRLAPTAPPDCGADPLAADQVVRNGLSCIRCHVTGVSAFADASGPALNDLPAADKARLAPLFPGKEAMDHFLADDQGRFQAAVKAIFGQPLDREPLGPVTTRFLKSARAAPVYPSLLAEGPDPVAVVAAGNRGLRDPLRVPLAELDAPSLPPLDGLTLPQYEPPLPPVDVAIRSLNFKTSKETTVFAPGDQIAIEVANQGKKDVYFELIGASLEGRMIVHQPPVKLEAGKTYVYPRDRPNKPKPFTETDLPPGVDQYILYAADTEFPAGVRLRSSKDKDIADRVTHQFWEISPTGDAVVNFDPSHLIKKTLNVETREH